MDPIRELVTALARRAAREPDIIFRERDYTQPMPRATGGSPSVSRAMAADAASRRRAG